MTSFSDFGLSPSILEALDELGFQTPTPIQALSIPQLLKSNQDLIALAQTGTGKTAAYGLPIIQLTDLSTNQPQAIILSPTRELCVQISKDLETYAKGVKSFKVLAIYGGASIENQIKALNQGVHVVVGTPGRVSDLLHRRRLKLNHISKIVLDEADEMLSMGFKDDLDFILSAIPTSKQTMLFSATMPKEIQILSNKYMNSPIELSDGKKNSATAQVEHIYYMVQAKDRYQVLKRIADINPKIYGIVFCRTRRETKEVANKLMGDGYNADALHGDLSQAQRDEVMGRFRLGHIQLLVATDVAARGLDVNNLTHIINYDLPDESDIYTHRSGRTGRAGKKGISIAIIHSRETRKLQNIEKVAGIKFKREMVPDGREICSKQLFVLIDKVERVEIDETTIEPFLPDIYKKLEWLDREQLIKHFVSVEFNRFLTYYKDAKDINIYNLKEDSSSRRKDKDKDMPMSRIHLNIGLNNKLNPLKLLSLVNEALDTNQVQIGRIEILRNFSFFEIDTKYAESIIKSVRQFEIDGQTIQAQLAENKKETNGEENDFFKKNRSRTKQKPDRSDYSQKKRSTGSRKR